MAKRLTDSMIGILRRVIQERAPEMMHLADRLVQEAAPLYALSAEERAQLGEVLFYEFSEKGLHENDEPNDYGLILEEIMYILTYMENEDDLTL